jgi:hypothetical protein
MTGPPPVVAGDPQARRDAEHLKLLSIFHFILAALGLFGIAFLALHLVLMSAIFTNPEMWKNSKNGPPPEILFKLMLGGYAFGVVVILTGGFLNLLSGLFIRKRRHRMFSIISGGLNCLHVPFGTLLGVFTILILSRDSVRKIYEVSGGNSSGTG